jgi:hypothetical protein
MRSSNAFVSFVHSRGSLLIALLLGVAGTIQYHSAQFLSAFDTFLGDRGDARGFVYFCEHWYQSILGKASLLSPGIFYPTKRTLAYSDLLFGFVAPYSFFRALGFSMFTATEIVIILITFLSYCITFVLLYRTLGFGLAPSCAGAMFFAFSSPKFHQLTHLQLQYVLLLPLIFALVITFAKQAQTITPKRAAILLSLVALCLILQFSTTFYFGWFLVLWSVLFFLLALAFRASRRFIITTCKKFWRELAIAVGVFLLGSVPLVLIYLPALRAGSWYRYDFVSQMIPDWQAALSMGDGNYLWSWFYQSLIANGRPATWGELMIGIGLIPSLAWITLTVFSIWLIAKYRNTTEAGTLFLAIMILATTIFYLIGFKYAGHSPWSFIYNYFPGAGAIRAVSRYVIFLTLPMSIGFAYGLHHALEFARKQQNQEIRRNLIVAFLVVAAVGVFEQFGVHKVNGTGFSKRVEQSYLKAMASKLPKDCTAFYVAPGPHANHSTAEYHYDAMLISILSRVKTLNASSSQFPRDWNMYFVLNPDYEAKVREWIDSQRISGTVCRLELEPPVEAFDPSLPSLVDDPEFFVRQLYRDFAGREPEAQVVAQQVEKIRNCKPNDETCERAQVALNIFLSTGFHERGSFILRMYESSQGRAPSYEEFMDAMGRFDEQSFHQRVENDEKVREFGNQAFVMLHYYGYLHRAPDPVGVAGWLDLLNRSGDLTRVTNGFITSAEYRQRFR